MKQPLNPKWHRLWLLLRRWERCQESFTTDSLGSSGPHGRFGSKAEELTLSRTSPLSSPTADIGADIVFRRFGPGPDVAQTGRLGYHRRRRCCLGQAGNGSLLR
jgi:hypothetical protein